jgi:5-methylcytosine-specific restriction protein A
MPLIPCLGCGRLIDKAASRRQGRHKRGWGRCEGCAAGSYISTAETQRRAETVAAWRAVHGDRCPGWRRPPHAASDLTADHVDAVGAGGREDGPLSVLCRSCNGRKADRLG